MGKPFGVIDAMPLDHFGGSLSKIDMFVKVVFKQLLTLRGNFLSKLKVTGSADGVFKYGLFPLKGFLNDVVGPRLQEILVANRTPIERRFCFKRPEGFGNRAEMVATIIQNVPIRVV